MAFNSNPGKQQFSASAGQTVFTFNFAIFANTNIKVYKTLAGAVANDTTDLLTLTTHYTVAINGTVGGTITLLTGASINDTITIARSLPISRATDYVTNGDLYADTLDADQDYQTYLVQDGYVQLSRAIIIPESLTGVALSIPAPIADSYLRWDVTATALENDVTIPQKLIDATTQAGIATTQAGNASASATLAQKWASELENVIVSGGLYSAYHWALKAAASAASFLGFSATTPIMDSVGAVGIENTAARGDHVHPSDTSKANQATTYTKTETDTADNLRLLLTGGTMTGALALFGISTAPTAAPGTNTTQIASTAFVLANSGTSLLSEYEVIGSAVTSIDFTGLDINLHKSYRIEVELTNATASIASIYCLVNNDTVITNYTCQYLQGSGTTVATANYNNATFATLAASSQSFTTGNMSLAFNKVKCLIMGQYTTTFVALRSYEKTATVTNITQLTFTSSVASSIGIGSKIRIYRGDI